MKRLFTEPMLDQLRPFSLVVLGAAPVMAAATTLRQGAVLGCVGAVALILVGLVLRTARRFMPAEVLVPLSVITAVVSVTAIGLLIQAFSPVLRRDLGIYLFLPAVSCLMLSLTVGNGPGNHHRLSLRALSIPAVQYAILVAALGLVREAFGHGTVLGWPLFGSDFRSSPVLVLSLAPGGFMVLGFGAGLYRWLQRRRRA